MSAWLSGAGFDVTGVSSGNRYLTIAGTAADVQTAFGVTMHGYRHDGVVERAPTTDITIPSTVASQVLGVTGLSTPQKMQHTTAAAPVAGTAPAAPPAPGFVNGRPCSAYYGQIQAKYQDDYKTKLPKFQGDVLDYSVCGYTPTQFRSAYGVTDTGLTGKGVTVAITDAYASPTVLADANTYATRHGDAKFTSGQYLESRPVGGFTHQSDCGPSGWYGEETLDVEAVHGIATKANVRYYASRSCLDDDFLDTLQRVVDENIASYVSDSWGEPDADETSGVVKSYSQVFKQGAMQGIGFLFSSGDNGDEVANTGLLQTDSPASNRM